MAGKTTQEPRPGEGSPWMPDLDTLLLCYRILLCQIKERIDDNPLIIFGIDFPNDNLAAFIS